MCCQCGQGTDLEGSVCEAAVFKHLYVGSLNWATQGLEWSHIQHQNPGGKAKHSTVPMHEHQHAYVTNTRPIINVTITQKSLNNAESVYKEGTRTNRVSWSWMKPTRTQRGVLFFRLVRTLEMELFSEQTSRGSGVVNTVGQWDPVRTPAVSMFITLTTEELLFNSLTLWSLVTSF